MFGVTRGVARTLRSASVAAMFLVSGACSLEGLDHFAFPRCSNDGRTGCEALNVRDHIGEDACELWQCSAPGGFCTFGDRDRDRDGHVAALSGAMACGGDDCDDDQGTALPGGTERCDGIDNDCNGLIDDVGGAMVTATAPVTVITGASSPTFVTIADVDDGVFVAWGTPTAGARTVRVDDLEMPPLDGSRTIAFSTNADATAALTSITPSTMCPDEQTLPAIQTEPCDAAGHCPGSFVCITAPDSSRLCEEAVLHTTANPPTECQSHAACQDGDPCNGAETCEPRGAATLIDARGCRMAASPSCVGHGRCDPARAACVLDQLEACSFLELDLGFSEANELLSAGITTDRCAMTGRVRPGLLTDEAVSTDVLWGDARLSTTWAGVDTDDDGCTGASRGTGPAGASGVSIAVLPRDATISRNLPIGLAAWRAGPPTAATASVEVLGLWREQTTVAMHPVRYADGSNGGIPLGLPGTTTSGRIGVAAYDAGARAGFVIASAAMGGGVSVTTIDLDAPAALCPGSYPCLVVNAGLDGNTGTEDDGLPSTSVDPVGMAGETRATASLGTPHTTTIDPTTTVMGDVSVATGTRDGSDVRVALAYATSLGVVISLGRVTPSSGVDGSADRIVASATGAHDVRVVHVESGLALAGQFASGTITEGQRGGFVVTWATSEGTFALRVADHGDAVIAPGAMQIGPPTDAVRAFVDYDAAMSHPDVRAVAHQGDAFVVFPILCGPPA